MVLVDMMPIWKIQNFPVKATVKLPASTYQSLVIRDISCPGHDSIDGQTLPARVPRVPWPGWEWAAWQWVELGGN